jgi:hypothetical protein
MGSANGYAVKFTGRRGGTPAFSPSATVIIPRVNPEGKDVAAEPEDVVEFHLLDELRSQRERRGGTTGATD